MMILNFGFAKQDGLLPVIVTDYRSNKFLMLAYMNEEVLFDLGNQANALLELFSNELGTKRSKQVVTINTSNH